MTRFKKKSSDATMYENEKKEIRLLWLFHWWWLSFQHIGGH